MSALLAIAAAIGWGSSDFAAGYASRKSSAISVVILTHFAAVIALLCFAVDLGPVWMMFGDIVRAERLMHGKTSMAKHDGKTVFDGLSNPFEVGRYHSLCAEHESLPGELKLTAQTERGEIMGVRHQSLPLEGVQFHPESVLTPEGDELMLNFMRMGEQ